MSVPRLFALLLSMAAAILLGGGTAYLAVRSPAPLDVLSAGPWKAWPRAGTADGDPYSRARLARTGEIPLGSGEGLEISTETDSSGAPLRARCDYRVAGQTPTARLWTAAVEPPEGEPGVPGRARAIGSDAILRRPDGSFELVVSPAPHAGNWISSAGMDRFRIVMRLYDTTARVDTAIASLVMPDVVAEGCE
ncbi:DUF1214 domain-containing protein [Propylenella binzhouense]|uniref:DUF1214 domain-containing protein n=1 Tax=Propylenella binzhouense TaxID=2555902 RepID=A0A964TAX0_9HYPH|nr:DUF1214 domain-containing protein [Propylenella binzhouense]MYZ50487.1 DUF1214 domain-containing protein [Propylenella binzhouense]